MNMKLINLMAALLLVCSCGFAQTTISKEERKKALDELKSSQKELLQTIKGLSEAQLNYKPSEEAWSIANCVEHLAISEGNFKGLIEMSLQPEADPSLRDSVKFADDDLLAMIVDRSYKVKTQKPFEPTNKYGGYEASLTSFKEGRSATIEFMKTTDDDLRNHYFDFPFGKADTYQLVLFMSGHTRRHLAQIKEVMASDGYPQ